MPPTFNCSSHCKCNSCVPAGCFNEGITRAELPLSFSLCDHAHCRSAHEIQQVDGVVLNHTCALQTHCISMMLGTAYEIVLCSPVFDRSCRVVAL